MAQNPSSNRYVFKPMPIAADDPHERQHRLVAAFLEEWWEATQRRGPRPKFKETKAGSEISAASIEDSPVLVSSVSEQLFHLAACFRAVEELWRDKEPDWFDRSQDVEPLYGRVHAATSVLATLFRRKFTLDDARLLRLLQACVALAPHAFVAPHTFDLLPLASILRFVETRAATGLPDELRESVVSLTACIRGVGGKEFNQLTVGFERTLVETGPAVNEESVAQRPLPIPPARVGTPNVLVAFKQWLGVLPPDVVAVAVEEVGLDRFSLRVDSPLRDEHAMITAMLDEALGLARYYKFQISQLKAAKPILKFDSPARARLLLAGTERCVGALLGKNAGIETPLSRARDAVWRCFGGLVKMTDSLDRDGVFDLLLYASRNYQRYKLYTDDDLTKLAAGLGDGELTDGERHVLYRLRASLILAPPLGVIPQPAVGLHRLVGDGLVPMLVPGEVWADELNADLTALPPDKRQAWGALFKHAQEATSSRPTAKWLKQATTLVTAIGAKPFAQRLAAWFPLVSRGASFKRVRGHLDDGLDPNGSINEGNAIILRGLVWMSLLVKSDDLHRDLGALALTAYRKVPGIGPRAVKVGNAAVYALSELNTPEAVGQLAMLKVRVKFGSAQKEIEKAFTAAAEALNIPRDQIEEMGVPTYGLEEVGLRRETFGDFTAELRVEQGDVTLKWFRADGKLQKSVPAEVKSNHKEDLKELQQAQKDIDAMLPAQAARIDAMFLAEPSWPIAAWRERYIDHPLIGTIARRLVWVFKSGETQKTGAWCDGAIVDANDHAITLGDDTTVSLWHPIGRPMEDVVQWRAWLERHEVRQPFKQAHREVYLLTDAERRTNTYSNRFAAHILRQHQFNALCAARGWKNKLRLMVDDEYPPATRDLSRFGLRAEYWIEGAGENFGSDTTDSGAFLYVVTDQVRFHRVTDEQNSAHAVGGGYGSWRAQEQLEPVPLEQIPPLVLSETLRDVDLFVGVASVGNDPNWNDGAHTDAQRTYWQNYSFGDLSATAQTRKAVLERLIPRLKIASRCTFSEKFLVVRGELRTYKIHLGSGNILMEPNDQYLCIVPGRGESGAGEKGGAGDSVFLPFEGDRTLSIILSKAFLLADDKKIKDPTITRQLQK